MVRTERITSLQLVVMQRTARCGAYGFYRGSVAEAIVAATCGGRGILSLSDLADISSVVRSAMGNRFDEYDILVMPPSSSGGIADSPGGGFRCSMPPDLPRVTVASCP